MKDKILSDDNNEENKEEKSVGVLKPGENEHTQNDMNATDEKKGLTDKDAEEMLGPTELDKQENSNIKKNKVMRASKHARDKIKSAGARISGAIFNRLNKGRDMSKLVKTGDQDSLKKAK